MLNYSAHLGANLEYHRVQGPKEEIFKRVAIIDLVELSKDKEALISLSRLLASKIFISQIEFDTIRQYV